MSRLPKAYEELTRDERAALIQEAIRKSQTEEVSLGWLKGVAVVLAVGAALVALGYWLARVMDSSR